MNPETMTSLDLIGSVPRCRTCGSERVVRDAWACWNRETGFWELEEVFDHSHCHQCGADAKLSWSTPEKPPNRRIRELNDCFRRTGQGHGTIAVTSGVQALGEAFVREAVAAVSTFDDFTDKNDPWGERDFAAVPVGSEQVFFKFDYYDPDLRHGSENPANEARTYRVLTIMLPSEY